MENVAEHITCTLHDLHACGCFWLFPFLCMFSLMMLPNCHSFLTIFFLSLVESVLVHELRAFIL